MTTCPNGHPSQSSDYCDVCGAPMGAAASPAVTTPPVSADVAEAPAATTKPCPHCGAANPADALFCEACGYDFTTGTEPREPNALDLDTPLPDAAAPSAPAAPAAAQVAAHATALPATATKPADVEEAGQPALDVELPKAKQTDDGEADHEPLAEQVAQPGAEPGEQPAVVPMEATPSQLDDDPMPMPPDPAKLPPEAQPDAVRATTQEATPESVPVLMPDEPAEDALTPVFGRGEAPSAAEGSVPAVEAPPVASEEFEWVAEVWVDPEWYAVQQAEDRMPSPGLPDVVPLRKKTNLIGRESRSRGISPEIDCHADNSCSRRQAQLTTDGQRWWVEDLDSANGTYVGTAGSALPEHPIPRGRVELDEDDRIYVGAWTRIVLRKATPDERAALA